MDILNYFTTISVLAGLVVLLSELLTKKTNVTGLLAQLQSWAISIGIVFLGTYSELTTAFVGMTVVGKLIAGVMVGLISNGIFDLAFIQQLLTLLKIKSDTSVK